VADADRESSDPVRTVALANLRRAVKQPRRARELVEAALRLKPDFDRAHLLSAALFEEEQNSAAALAEYQKISRDASDYPAAIRRATELLRGMDRLPEASQLAEQALHARPKDDELIVLSAELEEKRGDTARAVRRLEAALAERPRSESLLYGLAAMVERSGEWQRGIALMRKLVEQNPRSASGLNFIGYTYAERGVELPEAERLLRRAVTLAPDNGFILDSLGWCLF